MKRYWFKAYAGMGRASHGDMLSLLFRACPPAKGLSGRPLETFGGYTVRPAELQFMVRQVELYIDVINSLQRPDSKRLSALKSRVACAKRRGTGTAGAQQVEAAQRPAR